MHCLHISSTYEWFFLVFSLFKIQLDICYGFDCIIGLKTETKWDRAIVFDAVSVSCEFVLVVPTKKTIQLLVKIYVVANGNKNCTTGRYWLSLIYTKIRLHFYFGMALCLIRNQFDSSWTRSDSLIVFKSTTKGICIRIFAFNWYRIEIIAK